MATLSVEIVLINDVDFDGNPVQLKSATPSLDGVVVPGLKYSFLSDKPDVEIVQVVHDDLVVRGYQL